MGEGTRHVSGVDVCMCVSSKESTLPLISLSVSLSHFSLLTSSILLCLSCSALTFGRQWRTAITDKEKESSPSSLTNTHIHTIRNYSALWKLHEELAIIILQSTGAFRWSSRRVVQADAAERKVRW